MTSESAYVSIHTIHTWPRTVRGKETQTPIRRTTEDTLVGSEVEARNGSPTRRESPGQAESCLLSGGLQLLRDGLRQNRTGCSGRIERFWAPEMKTGAHYGRFFNSQLSSRGSGP